MRASSATGRRKVSGGRGSGQPLGGSANQRGQGEANISYKLAANLRPA